MFPRDQSVSEAGRVLVLLLCFFVESVYTTCNRDQPRWSRWWKYEEGISGPDRWADIRHLAICGSGKHQSPITIEPEGLLFDPNLKNLRMDFVKVNGLLKNTGNDITFVVNGSEFNYVNISAGPLSYMYRLHQIKFHFGRTDDISGSEHKISGRHFAGEIQLITYNSELYGDYTEAAKSPRGLANIGVFIQLAEQDNSAFNLFRKKFVEIEDIGTCVEVYGIPVEQLLPETDHYITYSGSMTQPDCKETVTWILYNKPIRLSHQQMASLRKVFQHWVESNTRPVMPLNNRAVRTNINFKKRSRLCSMEIEKYYQVNPRLGQ